MSKEAKPMKHAKALLVALAVVTLGGCASAGPEMETVDGMRPTETALTRTAGLHVVQAGLKEGEQAEAEYRQALDAALQAVAETPQNPKAYLLVGQAAVGVGEWVQADSMFTRAEEMYPPYADQIEAEREQGWVLAYNQGAAAVAENDLDRALAMFEAADLLFQGRPEARIGLGSVYANQGDLEASAEAYLGALEIAEGPPPAALNEEQTAAWDETRQTVALNAAQLLSQTGDFARAARVLQRYVDEYGAALAPQTSLRVRTALAGFYAQAGENERAEAMYEDVLGRDDLSADDYFQAGIGFFNTGDYARAADVFATAAELNPYSRDALLNLVQSLYSHALELEEAEGAEAPEEELRSLHQRTIQAGQEVKAMDPLNRNLISFMLRSYRSLADLSSPSEARELNATAQALFRSYQAQSYEVSDIQLAMQSASQMQIAGTLSNLSGTPGEQVQLRFDILDLQGQVVDSTMITVVAPAGNTAVQFSGTATVPGGEYAGWRYERVQ